VKPSAAAGWITIRLIGAEQIIRRHVDAFNAHDLDALLDCFADDATWVTGTDHFRGKTELESLFAGAFRALAPTLTVVGMLVDGDRVACELREDYTVDGRARSDHIAGFYRVADGRIVSAKIYREGSADV
jgi:uncharacterized protein (TIGR02246 family)